jgi:hypothetical protein
MEDTVQIYPLFKEGLKVFLDGQTDQVQQAVAKALLNLLLLKKNLEARAFLTKSVILFDHLEKQLRIDFPEQKIDFHGVTLSLVAILKLTDEELALFKEFVEGYIPKSTEKTLEEYLREHTNSSVDETNKVEESQPLSLQLSNALLSTMCSGAHEDFSISPPISDEELEKCINQYYSDKGFTVESQYGGSYYNVMKGDDDRFTITVTNIGGVYPTMVTVN